MRWENVWKCHWVRALRWLFLFVRVPLIGTLIVRCCCWNIHITVDCSSVGIGGMFVHIAVRYCWSAVVDAVAGWYTIYYHCRFQSVRFRCSDLLPAWFWWFFGVNYRCWFCQMDIRCDAFCSSAIYSPSRSTGLLFVVPLLRYCRYWRGLWFVVATPFGDRRGVANKRGTLSGLCCASFCNDAASICVCLDAAASRWRTACASASAVRRLWLITSRRWDIVACSWRHCNSTAAITKPWFRVLASWLRIRVAG